MGNSKSKKAQSGKFFERQKWKEQKEEERKKKKGNPINKRNAVKDPPLPLLPGGAPPPVPPGPGPSPAPPPAHARSYDDEALVRMRYQLNNDSDAFLLNNILLSVQFFENYERELLQIKKNPIGEREHAINEAMVPHHKHVFFADQLQECVHERVCYQRQRGQAEPLAPPRLYVIYDNVEASEPGDTSDYSAVLDAPFYKLLIEGCKEQGYVKLKKLEVLESTLNKENEVSKACTTQSDDSIYTESEKESIDSDEFPHISKGEELLHELKTKFIKVNGHASNHKFKANPNLVELSGRNRSLTKPVTLQVEKSNISNINNFQKVTLPIPEEAENVYPFEETEAKPRKSNLKTPRRPSGPFKEVKGKQYADISKSASENTILEIKGRRPSGPTKEIKNKQYADIYKTAYENTIPEVKSGRRPSGPTKEVKHKQYIDIYKSASENIIAEDTETSGYSTRSSRQNESSETESDYGYSTITMSATPKKLEVTEPSNYSVTSGVLPEECWSPVQARTIDSWSEDEDEELDDSASKSSLSRDLYETFYFLSSVNFMNNFVDNFIINLGSGLGISQETINSALTQGASIYCDTTKTGTRMGCEIFPALIAAWPNAANQWIIRERRVIQNPRTNLSYQWPTKYMVSKAIGFGCLLVPTGFRPKRGVNPDHTMQWRITFPAAERYLESCLAHSHMRCYLFAMALHKTFLEVESAKIGIDASHIKNHLFWQCEDNYAKWPEDRLGETLRLFLRTFYVHFGQARFPNYFIESCNDFKSIPKPLLMKIQRRLADILESPVMHVLSALDKLKYNKKDFYPKFNCYRLYEILTCKNPLRILNPNLPLITTTYNESSDSDDERQKTYYDKNYQWKKRQQKQRQIQERRNAQMHIRKQKTVAKQERLINTKFILPTRMEAERRRLVLDFFIPHFIAMARSSEKFEAIKQAVIYLEQAQRLCILLKEEPGGDSNAHEYMYVIRDKLADCQRKLVNQGGYKLPRRESQLERSAHRPIRKQRPQYEHIVAQDSPTENHGISAFTFVDVHNENSNRETVTRLNDVITEESKL